MEFEMINGKRKNSTLLYVISESQIYIRKAISRNKEYYICYNKNCKAKVEILDGVCSKPEKFVNHNHSDNEDLYNELKALNSIKTQCVDAGRVLSDVNALSGIRNTFQTICSNNQNATRNIDFNKIKRTLQKLTAKVFISSPKSALEVVEAFQRENIWNNFGVALHADEKYHFFKACIADEDFSFCVFASEKMIKLMQTNIPVANRNFLSDGTFSLVPVGCFNQLLIIYVEYFEKVFPFLFMVNKKSRKCNTTLLTYIHKNIVDLTSQSIMTDYEVALQSAIKESFSVGQIYGCWFHYCQAIRRNIAIKFKHLAYFIRSSKDASQAYHKILALPLLPATQIRPVFEIIKGNVNAFDAEGRFLSFFTYFEHQWMERVKPEGFSVFMRHTWTTSAIEAYNGVLGRMIQKNGNFFKFVKALQTEEFAKSRDFELLTSSGGSHGSSKQRKCFYMERARKIENASAELLAGKITAIVFINRMVFSKNSICVEMEPDDDIFDSNLGDDKDDHSNEEDRPSTSSNCKARDDDDEYLCIVCCVTRPNILLLPCKHLKLCAECFNKLPSDKDQFTRCPICRSIVVDNIQVYN